MRKGEIKENGKGRLDMAAKDEIRIEIRKCTNRDTNEQISKIYAQSWKSAYQGIVPQAYLDAITQNQWVPLVEKVRGSIWVAVVRQRPSGSMQQTQTQQVPLGQNGIEDKGGMIGRREGIGKPLEPIKETKLQKQETEMGLRGYTGDGRALKTTMEQIVGVCVYGPAREPYYHGWGEVRALYLLPGWGRMGIGSKLLQAAVESLFEEEYHSLYLWTLRENCIARRFYEKHGFQWDGQEKTEMIGGKALQLVRYCLETDGV